MKSGTNGLGHFCPIQCCRVRVGSFVPLQCWLSCGLFSFIPFNAGWVLDLAGVLEGLLMIPSPALKGRKQSE